jgi:hypothetical protein
MTKRILNAEKPVEEKAKPKKQPVKKEVKTVIWYRVAILKYDDPKLGFYTCVVDKPHHQQELENRINFVRWEPVVEVEV